MRTADRVVTVIPATINPKTRMSTASVQKRRVAGYARVSTDNDEQFTSYEAQIDYYTKFIQRNPEWQFVKVYTDEGISGTNTKHRDGFNEMIGDALAGKIDLIVTKSVSRFARNTVDSLTTIRMLKGKNVECFFEKENIYTFDGKGELLLTIMSSLAQEESRSISENVTWGKRKSFSDGKVFMPYKRFLGYRKGPDGLPEIDEEEAKVVRKIYDMYLSGMSLSAIGKALAEDGIKTVTGRDTWNSSTLYSILQNEKYKGSALLQKKYTVDFLTKKQKLNQGEIPQYYVEESHPAIIEPEMWELTQLEIARRKEAGRHYSGNNVFSSRIVCGDCGSFFGPKVWNSTSKYRHTIWRCNHKYASEGNDTGCSTPHLDEELIKDRFLDAVNEIIDNRDEILENCRNLYNSYSDNTALEKKINDCLEECELISDLTRQWIEKNSRTAMDQQEFMEKYNSYVEAFETKSTELEKLKADKLEREKKADSISAFMFELHERDRFVEEFSSELWNTMIDIVTVHHDGRMVFRFKNGKEVTR